MTKPTSPLQQQMPCVPPDLEELTQRVLQLRNEVLIAEKTYGSIEHLHPHYRNSARNLLQYLALRLHEVRPLQYELSEWALSSLGRAERKVHATLDTLLRIMHQLLGKPWDPGEKPVVCFEDGRRLLEENTEALLGETPSGRRVRIMVTMPTEAADNYRLALQLLQNGMNCARINCAHDNPEVWEKIISNIRRAEEISGLKCRILMDLGGPKLRTGPLEPGPAVLKLRPRRDEWGQVLAPVRLWFYDKEKMQSPADNTPGLPVDSQWLSKCRQGDTIVLKDARRSRRKMVVAEVGEGVCLVEMFKTVYLKQGLELHLKHKNNVHGTKLTEVPRREQPIALHTGDMLLLTRNNTPGRPAVTDETGKVLQPAIIGCSIPEVFDDLQPGEPIWFDDGKIGGMIERIETDQVHVRITHAKIGGEKLRSEKGINLPETNLHLNALTPEDVEALRFVVKYADMVGLSFANNANDVAQVIAEMQKLSNRIPGVVIKVETRQGFDNLPDMILTAMRTPICGVMIARGDLAIECGFGRLAELQEQILWVCEAAHVPVIWATQVLEGLTKQGLPTRAEVTDAAMGQRAECIMLNKGEHVVEATRALDDILRRMQDHQTKKRTTMRKLHLAEKFFSKNPEPVPAKKKQTV